MIERFTELLGEAELQGRVELKGTFCMERCGEGINWMIDDEVLSSPTVEAGTEVFKARVLAPAGKARRKRPRKGRGKGES